MIFDEHTVQELLQGLEAEVAKSISELNHAQADLEKAQNRHKFILAVIHHLKSRI